MKFKVVRVRDRGRRLTREEIAAAEPIEGELLISDLPKESNSARRKLRYADLLGPCGISLQRSLLKPLFDPSLVRATPTSMLLMGYEIEVVDRVIFEHAQGWLLRSA